MPPVIRISFAQTLQRSKHTSFKTVCLVYKGEKVFTAKNNLPLVNLWSFINRRACSGQQATGGDNIMEEDEAIDEMFYGKDK